MKRVLLNFLMSGLILVNTTVLAQDVFVGYDNITETTVQAWSVSASTFNASTAREIVIIPTGGSVKNNYVADSNPTKFDHFEIGGSAHFIEINLTANSSTSSFTVLFNGSSNSTTSGTCTAGIAYSDKYPFDETSIINVETTSALPAIGEAFSPIAVVPPIGTKSLRIYRRVYYGSGVISTSSGGGKVQYGAGNTIRMASITVFQAPITQASDITFTDVTSTDVTLNWAVGSGSKRAVFVKENGGVITNPVDGTNYTANTDWSTKGTQLATSGYYCVYNGTGNSVALTNLDLSYSYTVQIFDYNGTGSISRFLTTTATDNPKTHAAVLPTVLTSFKTITQADGIILNWATASENNADKFIVERRTLTSPFEGIKDITAKGKASKYAFTDENVTNGETYYYRLKMMDKDGSYEYSNLLSASFALKASSPSIYPNPAIDIVTITYPEASTNGSLYVIDSKGSVVIKSVIIAKSTQQNVDVSYLKTGVYLIRISAGTDRSSLKLIKN